MNNKFKRALSSVLAVVMMISVFATVNVSSVFAGTISSDDTTKLTGDKTTADALTQTGVTIAATDTEVKYSYTLNNASTMLGLTTAGVNTSNGKFDNSSNTTSSITFETDGVFDVTISNASNNTKTITDFQLSKITGENIGDAVDFEEDGSSYSLKNRTAGKYKITNKNTTSYLPILTITVYKSTPSSKLWLADGTGANQPSELNLNDAALTEYTDENGAAFATSIWGGTSGAVKGHKGYVYDKADTNNTDSKSFSVNITSEKATLVLYMVSVRTQAGSLNLTAPKECNISAEPNSVAPYNNSSITPITLTLEGRGEYTIAPNNPGKYYLFAASLTNGDTTDTDNTETNPSNPTEVKGTISGTVKLEKKASTDGVEINKVYEDSIEWTTNSKNEYPSNNVSIKKEVFSTENASGTATLLNSSNEKVDDASIENGAYSFSDVASGTYSVKLTVDGQSTTIKDITIDSSNKKQTADYTFTAKLHTVKITTNIKDYKSANTPVIKYGNVSIATLDDNTYKDKYTHTNSSTISTTHYIKLPAGDYTIGFYKDSPTFALQLEGGGTPAFSVKDSDTKTIEVQLQFVAQTSSVDTVAYNEYKTTTDGETYLPDGTTTFTTGTGTGYTTSSGSSNVSDDGGVQFNSAKEYVMFKLNKSALVKLTTANIACVIYTTDGTINGSNKLAAVDSSYKNEYISLTAGTYMITTTTDPTTENKAIVKSIEVSASSPFTIDDDKTTTRDNEIMIIGKYTKPEEDNGKAGLKSYDNFAILVSDNEKALDVTNLVDYAVNGSEGTVFDTADTLDGAVKGYLWENKDSKTKVLVDKTDTVYDRVVWDDDDDTIAEATDNVVYYAAMAIGATTGQTYYAKGATKVGNTWLVEDSVHVISGGEQ